MHNNKIMSDGRTLAPKNFKQAFKKCTRRQKGFPGSWDLVNSLVNSNLIVYKVIGFEFFITQCRRGKNVRFKFGENLNNTLRTWHNDESFQFIIKKGWWRSTSLSCSFIYGLIFGQVLNLLRFLKSRSWWANYFQTKSIIKSKITFDHFKLD